MFFLFIFSIILFLFSIDYISKHIENKISYNIKKIIIKINHNKLLLLLFGILSTSLFQSSSLIIALIIVLTDSNKIDFDDSIYLMMGSNIGTCSTAFITSIDGNYIFCFLILFYILIRLITHKKAQLIIGIILLLISVKILDYSVIPMGNSYILLHLFANNTSIINILVSSIITAITQSSSSMVAAVQSFTSKNIINIKTASDMIIGSNIGTCITAFIVSIKGNKLAKKCAWFNLFFNILGVISFLIFRYFINIYLYINVYPVKLQVAYIHLIFNILNVIAYIVFFRLYIVLCKHTRIKFKKKIQFKL